MLSKATAGMGVPLSVSPCIGATCPFIIFESADIDSAVDEVIETAFKKKREVTYANKCDVPFCQTTASLTVLSFSLPSGPLGAVCAGEHCGQCCDPSQAPYGRDEVCGPAQWWRQGPGGCCNPRSSAAGGHGKSEPPILAYFMSLVIDGHSHIPWISWLCKAAWYASCPRYVHVLLAVNSGRAIERTVGLAIQLTLTFLIILHQPVHIRSIISMLLL